MRVFERLRVLRAFENQYLGVPGAGQDCYLIGEIGYHQAKGKPLTLKQLFHLDVGSIATVQRHLRRLKELGLVHHQRHAADQRTVELSLTPKCLRVFAKYSVLMSSQPPLRQRALGNGEPRHVCALCDSDAGCRQLMVTFLAQGQKQGDKCVLVAPPAIQHEILRAMSDRRKAPRDLAVSEGYDSADALLAFFKRLAREARRAGQNLRITGDMSWAQSRDMPVAAMLDFEKRLDALARQASLNVLCVYDARRFSSADFLHAVKCHRDHSRYPIMTG